MPYIPQYRRAEILSRAMDPETPGDINYLISALCNAFLATAGVNYTNVNTLVGALECAKLELYRRIAVPYEDEKIRANGDVYDAKD